MLDAAYTLLLRDGPGALSMDALAAEASVSKPTIYTHFGSRAELCREMVSELAGTLVDDLRGTVPVGKTVSERLKDVALACLRSMTSDQCTAVYRMLVVEGPRDPAVRGELLQAALEPVDAIIGDHFAEMIDSGDLRGADAQTLTLAFIGMIKGAWLIPVLSGVRPPLSADEAELYADLAATVLTDAYAVR